VATHVAVTAHVHTAHTGHTAHGAVAGCHRGGDNTGALVGSTGGARGFVGSGTDTGCSREGWNSFVAEFLAWVIRIHFGELATSASTFTHGDLEVVGLGHDRWEGLVYHPGLDNGKKWVGNAWSTWKGRDTHGGILVGVGLGSWAGLWVVGVLAKTFVIILENVGADARRAPEDHGGVDLLLNLLKLGVVVTPIDAFPVFFSWSSL
jgi:hypothetical protein